MPDLEPLFIHHQFNRAALTGVMKHMRRQAMTRTGSRFLAALGLASAMALGGCAYDDGYGYGGVSIGTGYYGGGGYYGDGYYGPYGYAPGGYGGWYNDYYYPGRGYYVYDRAGARHRWNDSQRRYWEARRKDRPGNGRPGDGRPGYGRPGDGRPGDGRPGWDRPGDGRPDGNRPGDGRPGGRPGWNGGDGRPNDGNWSRPRPPRGNDMPGRGRPGASGGDQRYVPQPGQRPPQAARPPRDMGGSARPAPRMRSDAGTRGSGRDPVRTRPQ